MYTSIPSAFFDTSKPMRQLITQKWFENEAAGYDLYISALTIEEIERLRNPAKLLNIRGLLARSNLNLQDITDEAVSLGEDYMQGGAGLLLGPVDSRRLAAAPFICTPRPRLVATKRALHAAAICRVASEEPPSATMISSALCSCCVRSARSNGRVSASLSAGIITESRGGHGSHRDLLNLR